MVIRAFAVFQARRKGRDVFFNEFTGKVQLTESGATHMATRHGNIAEVA